MGPVMEGSWRREEPAAGGRAAAGFFSQVRLSPDLAPARRAAPARSPARPGSQPRPRGALAGRGVARVVA